MKNLKITIFLLIYIFGAFNAICLIFTELVFKYMFIVVYITVIWFR